jgi:hypothetical protein
MPVVAHRRLTFAGIIGPAAIPYEAWTFRLNLSNGEPGLNPQTLLDAALAAYTTHLAGRIRPTAILKEIKYADIGAGTTLQPGGAYVGNPLIKVADVAGTATGDNMPSQIAQVVSLDTGLRGPRNRGRFYVPMPACTIDLSNGLNSTANSQALANAAAAFMGALNGPAGFGNVSIVSSSGSSRPVTSCRVGRVMDTIRSRRAQMAEAYGADVLVPS